MVARVSSTAVSLTSVAQTSAFGARSATATAIAPEPLPTSTTRPGSEPIRASARSTRRSVAGLGVMTRPGAVRSRRPAKEDWARLLSTLRSCRPRHRSYLAGLEDLLAADERAQALVLLAAGRAAGEVGAQARDRRVGVLAGELELDVAVEVLEALVAADFGLCRPEEPAERLLEIGSLHQFVSSGNSMDRPRSSR